MLRRETILVVDDEEDVRTCLAEALCREGYVVDTIGDGFSALERLGECPIDLVLADYRMPRMNGIELIHQIRLRSPDQAALLMTSYRSRRDAPGRGVVRCARKPIDLEDLVWMIDCEIAAVRSRPEGGMSQADQAP